MADKTDNTEPDDGEPVKDPTLSPSSQIGREETGGSGMGTEPGTDAREGWPMPDQTDTPSDWPEPTID